MARVFPSTITTGDVATMLAAIADREPYLYDGSACFDFDMPNLMVTVSVAVEGRGFDAAARQNIVETITILPRLHEWVARLYGSDGEPDDQDLGSVEVTDDRVDLNYCAREYNSSWAWSFRKDGSGRWCDAWGMAPVDGL